MTSLVDHLADSLGRGTGTTFTVLRRRVPPKNHPCPARWTGLNPRILYALRAERDGHRHVFWYQGLTVNQMKLNLATMLDMRRMGYVPVLEKEPKP